MSELDNENPESDTAEPVLDIQSLIDSDLDGLLDTPEKPKKITAQGRLERAFLEIVEFNKTHNRLPSSSTRDIAERKLGARLEGILANEEKIAALKPLDDLGLLEFPKRRNHWTSCSAVEDSTCWTMIWVFSTFLTCPSGGLPRLRIRLLNARKP